MKKAIKIISGLLLVLFILLVSIPLLFQDKIIGLVKETVNNNLNATVDFKDGDLSLLRNFPNASVQLSGVSVINHAPFEGDTLVYAKSINLKLRLTELFKASSEQLSIQSFGIDGAQVNIHTNAQGKANYDIAKKTTVEETTATTDTEPSNFGLSIKEYSITDTRVLYEDLVSKISVLVEDLQHRGSGDFSQKNSELSTRTNAAISLAMDGVSYAKQQHIDLTAVLAMDLVNMKFSFLKNEAHLNQLPLVFDGFVKLNDHNQEVALNFSTPSSDFKNFLALLPEVYAKNINQVKTTGNFSVKGAINGIIDEKRIPKFDIAMNATNASFKYPELPKSIENIFIDVHIDNKTGNLKNTAVTVNNLAFQIDQDKFSGSGKASNLLSNPYVNASLKGSVNLGNIHKAYPLPENTKLQGIVNADLQTRFDVEAIKKNNVERIKNTGTIGLNDFEFSSKDVVNPIKIQRSTVQFSPKTISLTEFKATSGKSDFSAKGKLQNFLGFLLAKGTLQGTFALDAKEFHVSDFMQANSEQAPPSKEDSPEEPETPAPGESLKIPAFLDCKLIANAQKVVYDNLELKNVRGTLLIKDQKAVLQNVSANMFKGRVAFNGEISTQQKTPTFDMKLGINTFDIAQSFTSMDLLQSISPIAGAVDGKLNSEIALKGKLTKEFTPDLNSISGNALAELLASKINPEKTKALSLLNDKLSFIDLSKLDLSKVKTQLSFSEGKVKVAPFKLNYEDIGISIGGTHGFDQSMDYTVNLEVPAKYLGKEASGILSKLSPEDQNIKVPITAAIKGSMTNPSVQTDLASSITKLSQQLIEKKKNKLVNNTLNSLLGGTKKDKTKGDTKGTDKTVDKVKDVLGGLFGKKKTKKKN
ncbi:conserved hypothetical protein [Tenacibaculum litopenaei]|uniref:AsmA-like C-terminal region-containing protein n=1 Tax=Tenacibaculum litopenaei TaxID=396016 RepID=UPI003896625D